jgi:hypothetical protein
MDSKPEGLRTSEATTTVTAKSCGRLTTSTATEKGHTQTKGVARVFAIDPVFRSLP